MQLTERDRKYIWHPFTPQKNMAVPIPIIRGKGSLLYDDKDNAYIDAISSWWVTLHGHAHPYIAEKIYRQALQLEQVIFAGFTHQPAVDLAERLINLLPEGFSKIFYSDNGSTSTEVALKMAVQYWWNKEGGEGIGEREGIGNWELGIGGELQRAGKSNKPVTGTQQPATGNQQPATSILQPATGVQPGVFRRNKILAFKNAYHGDTFGAMSVSDRSVFTLAFHDLLFEVIFIDTPAEENISTLQHTIDTYSSSIAAFIYEPLVQGAGGMKMYDAALMNTLLQTVKRHNIICIADEVMTGFGRTGKLFASAYMHEQPDIICMSKGLTGGTMALGATACNEKIYSAFVNDDKLKTFFHGHSFTANPLACTAANASMDLLQQEETQNNIQWIVNGNVLFKEVLISRFGSVCKNVRTLGTILAFEIAQGKDEYLNNISGTITEKALQKGVYIRPLGNTVYIMPPYCITKEEIQVIQQTIMEILDELR